MKNYLSPLVLACSTLTLLVALTATVQAEDPIKKAEQQLADLEFEEAQTTALGALKEGNLDAEDVTNLYMLLGQIAASSGDDKDASKFFHNALSINIEARLPEGVSPKLIEPFDAAKERLAGATPIELDYEPKGSGRVLVKVVSDPANLIGGAMLTFKQGKKDRSKKSRGRDTIKMKIPEDAKDVRLAAVDQYGNQLNKSIFVDLDESGGDEDDDEDDDDDEKVKAPKTSVATSSSSSTPIHKRWQLYAGLSLGAFIGGGYFSIQALGYISDAEDLDDGTEFTEAQKLQDKADTQALLANISFVGAAILGGTAYYFYRQQSKPEASPKAAVIVPILSPSEVGVAASLRF